MTFDDPVNCLIAIANEKDLGVYFYPLDEIKIMSGANENILDFCLSITAT